MEDFRFTVSRLQVSRNNISLMIRFPDLQVPELRFPGSRLPDYRFQGSTLIDFRFPGSRLTDLRFLELQT